MPESFLDTLVPQDDAHLHEGIENSNDRQLLEYIAENMLTPDRLMSAIVEQLPTALRKLDDSPTARALLKLFL